KRPLTLLLEIETQLGAQFPMLDSSLQVRMHDLRRALSRYDESESEKNIYGNVDYATEFATWANEELPKVNALPILIGVDTFEEAQFLGRSAVLGVSSLLTDLLNRIERLRVVMAGRALPRDFPLHDVAVPALEPPMARELLRKQLVD